MYKLVKRLSRGVLIVFEGIDGTGKSTQIKRIKEFLMNKEFQVTTSFEPNPDNKWGELIKKKIRTTRDVSPKQELEWYINDRKWDLDHNIKPSLKEKHVVIIDRYYMSNAAYQGALDQFDLEYILEKNSFATTPDLWIIFDLSVEIAQSRIQTRKFNNTDALEKASYQKKVRQNYELLTKMDIGGEIRWIDASKPVDIITEELKLIIMDLLEKYIIKE